MTQIVRFTWDNQIGPVIRFHILNRNFSLCACHRLPERSIKCFGLEKFFCSRCIGIFFGGIIGIGFITFNVHIPISSAIVLIIPLIVDGLTQAAGLRESTNVLRLLTGVLFGFALIGVKI